jgi:GTPase SAR1 family protein
MGICNSKSAEQLQAEKLDAEIARMNMRDHEREQQKIKLLLLGAGESGKSTIFKQMKILYGTGFGDDDRKAQVPVVHSNTIASIKVLIQACEDLDIEIETAKDEAAALGDMSEETPLDETIAKQVTAVWNDAGIQAAYVRRNEFQLNDSAKYFFTRASETWKDEYIPTVEDILKVRVRTSGIVEEEYVIDGVKFAMYDVGGQRNERKKWIHCFDEVTAVIFVAAISEYDQVLYEDNTQNRMVESLNVFHEICNSKWFENTSIILFLNKRDLFEEKIKIKDIRQPDPADPERMLFDDYDGGLNYEAGVSYIVNQYLAQNDNKDTNKEIFWHVTCATDTSNISAVFNACKEIILRQNLEGSGFME